MKIINVLPGECCKEKELIGYCLDEEVEQKIAKFFLLKYKGKADFQFNKNTGKQNTWEVEVREYGQTIKFDVCIEDSVLGKS